ncbi:MAG: DNA mismatch repair endonuclease MutL [Bacillota bacterium]|nr:DNA mismatch repair endonuclease MutL [Bacillota bacterium]
MKRINLLSTETSNKIAAGEVVERPFSVIKELVENSIDAEAKNIIIEVKEGGQKYIKITDDGYGIYPEDVHKAFLPHATSKIGNVDDIYSLTTFGFRGEALASISAVSNTILRSRTKDFDYGKEISISGGIVDYVKDVGCNIGTTIEVSDLFFNVPARKKFLKSYQREAALISDIVNRLALANTNVSFRLFNNSKKVLTTYSTENLLDTIRSIYGKTVSESLIQFEKHSDIASVHGYIGNSEISRGSRNNQSIFINKRYVKNKLITTAVEQAFKSFLTINKFPFFVLFLDIFPEYVDVNVHPTKSEVKFRDDREIFKLVFDAVHHDLRNSLNSSYQIEEDYSDVSLGIDNTIFPPAPVTVQLPIDLRPLDNEESRKLPDISAINNNPIEVKEENFKFREEPEHFKTKFSNDKAVLLEEKEKETDTEYKIIPEAKFPMPRVIGQFSNTYILCEGPDGLFIVDQHAAHEKILFEKYREEIKNREVTAQVLISPIVIELTPDDYIYYIENTVVFKNIGFNIEPFGENTISIREVPLILGKPDINGLFMSILDNIKNMGSGETIDVKYNKIASLACKAAVKANDNLSMEEMRVLIETLRFIQDPFNCPHGRPTIIKITLNELEKRFKRIQ